MNGAHGLGPVALWDMVCAGTMTLTLLAAVWHGRRHAGEARGSYTADWPIAVVMTLLTAPAAGFGSGTFGAQTGLMVSTALTEVGMAWLYVRWGSFLSCLDLRLTVGCIFAAHVVGCVAKLALQYVPAGTAVWIVALLPVASMAMLQRACARVGSPRRLVGPAAVRVRRAPSSSTAAQRPDAIWCTGRGVWGPLWKVAAFVACYRLIHWAIFLVQGSPESLSLSTICCLAEIVVALIIIYMLLVRSGSFTFQQVWSIFLLLLGFVLLCALIPGEAPLGTAVRAAAGSLLVMFTWLVFADISHHSTLHPFVIFGVARIAYEVPRLMVEGLALAGMPLPADDASRTAFAGVLFFALLVFAIWFFDWRDPTLALIFSDFRHREDGVDVGPGAVRAVCKHAVVDYGLTSREADVLLYLCQGRTRAYIAETLYLSENTVRGHTQRIYAKMGVHTKTELQRLLGV